MSSPVRPNIGLRELRLVQAELVDQLLVAGDASVRWRRRFAGEHAAQAGETLLPAGGEAGCAVAVVERVDQRERGAVAVWGELECQPVGIPGEREAPRLLHLDDGAGHSRISVDRTEAHRPAGPQVDLDRAGEPLAEMLGGRDGAPDLLDRVRVPALDMDGRAPPDREELVSGHR
jgi:hypothetical protein